MNKTLNKTIKLFVGTIVFLSLYDKTVQKVNNSYDVFLKSRFLGLRCLDVHKLWGSLLRRTDVRRVKHII